MLRNASDAAEVEARERRRQFAMQVKDHPHKNLLFALYDNKSKEAWDKLTEKVVLDE